MSINLSASGKGIIGVLLGASLASCGGSEKPPPVAASGQFSVAEDSLHTGSVHATTTTGNPLRYVLIGLPANGTVTVDTTTGAFTYIPNRDYFGTDAFQFRATDGHLLSQPASISIMVLNVNDPPVLQAIANVTNSPETLATTIALQIAEVDGDTLNITATASDTAIATIEASGTERSITVTPIEYGETKMRVSVADSEFVSEQTFTFEVRDVVKSRNVEAAMTAGEMITLTNELTRPVTITLEHNGFPMFQSDEEIVQFVRDMPPEHLDEPFERKLWRFTRDNVYHNVPLNNDRWLYDLGRWSIRRDGDSANMWRLLTSE